MVEIDRPRRVGVMVSVDDDKETLVYEQNREVKNDGENPLIFETARALLDTLRGRSEEFMRMVIISAESQIVIDDDYDDDDDSEDEGE